jgi:hypothetical protein
VRADPIISLDPEPDEYVSEGFYDIDFDQDGNPEFRLTHDETFNSDQYTTTYTNTHTHTGTYTNTNTYPYTYSTYTYKTFYYYYRYAHVGIQPLSSAGDIGKGVMGYVGPAAWYWGGDKWASYLSQGSNVSPAGSWLSQVPGESAHLLSFSSSFAYETGGFSTSYGPWPIGDQKYLGVRFELDGDNTQTYYGWIELSIEEMTSGFTVYRYGYNTTANADIPAAVEIQGLEAVSGWRAVATSALAALTGALSWARRKITGK